jgi:transposase InsO family protein
MPWKVSPVSQIRLAFVLQVRNLQAPVAVSAREFGISRKTAYKWLRRHDLDPQTPLADRSRKPHLSPARTDTSIEKRVLEVRAQFGWGPRKIRAFLAREEHLSMPSIRTVANILRRQGALAPTTSDTPDLQRFQRDAPNQLWQCDHKGPLEIDRQKIYPFSVLDDHSRFLLALEPCLDLSMKTAFDVLWTTFGEFGLPDALLCDNAFSTTYCVPKTLSWFEAQLIRLGVRTLHGRPYHPQTQGKAERFHGTLERELWPRARRDNLEHFRSDLDHWRLQVYNTLRPHEALADDPPLARFRPSNRPRPQTLPPVEYPPQALLRRVSKAGDVCWRGYRFLAGHALAGELVRIEETDQEICLFYSWKKIRSIPRSVLQRDKIH